MIRDNIDGLNYVGMFQGGPDTEFGGYFLLVLSFRLARAFWPEFLDSENSSTILTASLDQTNGSTCTTSKDTTPFAILLGKMGVGSILKRNDRMRARGGRARPRSVLVAMSAVIRQLRAFIRGAGG